MSFKLLDKATAVKASPAIRLRNKGVVDHTIEVVLNSRKAIPISAATVLLQGSMSGGDKDTGVITSPALAIGSTPERFANGDFLFLINGVTYSKSAGAAGSQFSAAHVVTAAKWGVINIYINAAGAFTTRAPAANQAYDTEAAAHSAADVMPVMAAECYVGRILINAGVGNWTANTDDMTDASDVTTATFLSAGSSFYTLDSHELAAGEITAQRAMYQVTGKHADYARVVLSALTGDGEVTVRYTPVEVRP